MYNVQQELRSCYSVMYVTLFYAFYFNLYPNAAQLTQQRQRRPFLPVSLAAELAQVDAAKLAAALSGSFPAQVAPQRAVRHQALPENLVEGQVVGTQTLGPRRREVHLGVTVGTQHRDGRSILSKRSPGCSPADVRGRDGEGLQLPDAVGAEGVQTRQDFGLPVQPFTHVTNRPRVLRDPVSVHVRLCAASVDSFFCLRPRHVALLD